MTVDYAVKYLKKMYVRAKEIPNIQKPLAYALYQTWKYVDCHEAENLDVEKCKDCKYLDLTDHSSIGYRCTNPDKHFQTSTSCWKYTSNAACKHFEPVERWNGMHGRQITAPKGTFEQIYNDNEEDNDI